MMILAGLPYLSLSHTLIHSHITCTRRIILQNNIYYYNAYSPIHERLVAVALFFIPLHTQILVVRSRKSS